MPHAEVSQIIIWQLGVALFQVPMPWDLSQIETESVHRGAVLPNIKTLTIFFKKFFLLFF